MARCGRGARGATAGHRRHRLDRESRRRDSVGGSARRRARGGVRPCAGKRREGRVDRGAGCRATAGRLEHEAFFFEDGAEPAQFDGYEAIGHELLDAAPEPPGAVVVPVGNGALAIGVFRAIARRAPETLRVAVAAAEAPAMYESWQAGRAVE